MNLCKPGHSKNSVVDICRLHKKISFSKVLISELLPVCMKLKRILLLMWRFAFFHLFHKTLSVFMSHLIASLILIQNYCFCQTVRLSVLYQLYSSLKPFSPQLRNSILKSYCHILYVTAKRCVSPRITKILLNANAKKKQVKRDSFSLFHRLRFEKKIAKCRNSPSITVNPSVISCLLFIVMP
jgi:hypothetical protein